MRIIHLLQKMFLWLLELAHLNQGTTNIKIQINLKIRVSLCCSSKETYADKESLYLAENLHWLDYWIKNSKRGNLVHRRDAFRGIASEEMMRDLVKNNIVKLHTPHVIEEIIGSNKVDSVSLKTLILKKYYFWSWWAVILFGWNNGPILEWDLDLNSKKISVNTKIFKLLKMVFLLLVILMIILVSLILSWFSWNTLAVQEAYKEFIEKEFHLLHDIKLKITREIRSSW